MSPTIDEENRVQESAAGDNSVTDVGAVHVDIEVEVEFPEEEEEEEEGSVTFHSCWALDPPISSMENFRDVILRALDRRIFQLLGIVALFFIVVDGAFFFFLLLGWHGMCDSPSKTDCDPRNMWYNISVQLLNALFTYTALETVSWRCANFIHILGWSCPYRSNEIGRDLYGMPTRDMWFNIPLRRRGGITVVLMLNCFTQFANQATRLVYETFDQQNTPPGNFWTNVFFGLSMICAAVGAGWFVYEEQRLVKSHPPGTFPPGLIEVVQAFVAKHRCRSKRKGDNDPETTEAANEQEAEDQIDELEAEEEERPDPTRNTFHLRIIPAGRPAMRMFGL